MAEDRAMTEETVPANTTPVAMPGKVDFSALVVQVDLIVAQTAALIKRSHIGDILTISAILENQLRSVLDSHMPHPSKKLTDKLYDASGPLATFSAKIKIAQAFGIIPAELAAELDKIKGIRNTFAHTDKAISFETPEVISDVNRLVIRSSTKDKPAQAIFNEACAIAIEGLVNAHKTHENPMALPVAKAIVAGT
jgi:DNA-binding MltR family transcriptional regulator